MSEPVAQIRGLYGIADVSGAPHRSELELAEAYLRAGVTTLQLRMKDAEDAEVRAVLRALIPRCRAAGCALIVDDRVSLAAELGVGVHLGQQDLAPTEARRILGPAALIGWSTHSLEDVARARTLPVDYLGFGPVFSSAGKHLSPTDLRPPMEPRGLASLAPVVAAATVPVVAIGGIDAGNLAAVLAEGVAAAAVISAVSRSGDLLAAARHLVALARSATPQGS